MGTPRGAHSPLARRADTRIQARPDGSVNAAALAVHCRVLIARSELRRSSGSADVTSVREDGQGAVRTMFSQLTAGSRLEGRRCTVARSIPHPEEEKWREDEHIRPRDRREARRKAGDEPATGNRGGNMRRLRRLVDTRTGRRLDRADGTMLGLQQWRRHERASPRPNTNRAAAAFPGCGAGCSRSCNHWLRERRRNANRGSARRISLHAR